MKLNFRIGEGLYNLDLMKQLAATLLVVLLLSITPAVRSLRIQQDYADSDYMFGRDRGQWTSKWMFVRGIASRAFDYYETLLTSLDSTDLILDNHASPVTGRLIKAMTLSSGTANNYFYVEAYVKADDKMLVRTKVLQNNTNGRPNAAVLSINLHHVDTNTNNHYHYFPLFCREIFRGIVFDKMYFPKFLNLTNSNMPFARSDVFNSSDVGGANREFFKLNQGSFLDYAKTLYSNVTSFPGVMMENDGDEYFKGNAWEQSLYVVDILNPVHSIPMHFTKFSMSVAVASGWYSFSTTTRVFQAALYGLGSGSENFTKTSTCLPSGSWGSCTTEGAKMCGPDTEFKAVCSKSEFGGSCLYLKGTDYCFLNNTGAGAHSIERFGPNSRCIMGRPSGASEDIPLCLRVLTSTGGTTTVTFQDKDNNQYACTGSDVTVNGHVIRCPTNSMLTTRIAGTCTDDCNGNGVCFGDGSTSSFSVGCRCFWGWSGATCNTAVPTERDFMIANPYNLSGVGLVKLYAQIAGVSALVGITAMLNLN